MKINSLEMITRTGEFVDLLLNVTFEQLQPSFKPLLCLTYDKAGECVICGFLEGVNLYEFPLTEPLISQINAFIMANGLYEEVMEIVNEINKANQPKQVKIS